MKLRSRQSLVIAVLVAAGAMLIGECFTRIIRGWWADEPFYHGRPASFWADEIERWETQTPPWDTQIYKRRSGRPRWAARLLPEPRWPQLLDGDPAGRAALEDLLKHPSENVREWAKIGIDRLANDERGPIKLKHPSVILIASLHEVDPEFYDEVAKGKWHSMAELEMMEQKFLEGQPPVRESLVEKLDQQKVQVPAKETRIEIGKEEVLLASTRHATCLPSPAQVRKGDHGPQSFVEGMRLSAQADVSPDRRPVRVTLIEKIRLIEGIDKVTVLLDNAGTQAKAEIPAFKEATFTTTRNLPEGATFLLPLQYQSDDARKTGCRWVARIVARIYIEAEERRLKGAMKK